MSTASHQARDQHWVGLHRPCPAAGIHAHQKPQLLDESVRVPCTLVQLQPTGPTIPPSAIAGTMGFGGHWHAAVVEPSAHFLSKQQSTSKLAGEKVTGNA